MLRGFVLHEIQTIGEAASRLSEATKNRNPGIPWKRMTAMRNIIVHDYADVSLDEVWDVLVMNMPELKPQIESLIKELE